MDLSVLKKAAGALTGNKEETSAADLSGIISKIKGVPDVSTDIKDKIIDALKSLGPAGAKKLITKIANGNEKILAIAKLIPDKL